jgi:septal ring factor EnvC (AmiA/AmiB activator)
MEDKTTVVIDIQLDEGKVADRLAKVNQEMSSLRSENAQLRKDVKDGTKTWQDVSVQLAANEAKLKTLKAEQSALSGQVAQATQKNREYGTSLKEQSALLEDLRNRYKSLNEEQRNSEGGQALLEQIQELDSEMKATDATMGLFQRNVGDYTNSIVKAFGLTGNAAKAAGSGINFALGQVANGLKAVIAIPIVAAIGLLAVAVAKVRDAFKRSEEATMGLREALAPLQPLTDAVRRGFDAFATVIVKTVGVAINGLIAGVGGLLAALQKVGNFFGADWHMGDNFKAATTAARELQAAENDYIKNKRAWSVESAKIDREVADLREKASDKERYNAQQRLDFLDKAIALETKKAEQEKALAEQNLDILRAEAQRSANSAEANEKLAEAERAVIEADTRLADTKRNLNRQRQQAVREINGETEAIVRQTDAIREEIKTIKALSIDELTEANARKNKELADNIQKVVDRIGLLDETFEKLPTAEELFGDLADVTDENLKDTTTAWELFAEAFKNNAKTIQQTASSLSSSFGSLSSIYETMAKDETKSEAEREKAAKKAKRWSALQIAANSGTAIAKGVASAMDVPWPANIGAIASVMAAVLAAIAQAKSLAAESHEHGGVVGGRFVGAVSGPDDVLTTAKRGELFLNAEQQRRLFDIANGGYQPNMAAQLALALQSMPNPVLDYKEFTNFQQRVVTLNENTLLQ